MQRYFRNGLYLLVMIVTPRVWTQIMPVPAEMQFALFPKILGFDRNLGAYADGEIVIAVLYEGSYRISFETKKNIQSITPQVTKIEKYPVRYEFLDVETCGDLETALGKAGAHVVYVCPMKTPDLRSLIRISHDKKMITLTGVEAYVQAGLTVGVGVRNDRPLPIINLAAARAVGADFNSKLLTLCKVLQ